MRTRTPLVLAATLAAAFALTLALGRAYANHESTRATFFNDHQVATTPGDLGAPFDDIRIPVEGRTLDAFVVRAAGARAAVLLCHGVDETIASWAHTQKYLYDRGVSSMVFDYSAYGRSTGEEDISHLRGDAAAAYHRFEALFGGGTRRFILGLSLGVAICLSAYPDLGRGVAGIVLTGAWSSTRAIAVNMGDIPGPLAFIVPQTFDNVAAVRRVDAPLLIVQASADRLVPMEDARRIFDAANEPKAFVVADGFGHNAPWERAEDAYWKPILDFLERTAR